MILRLRDRERRGAAGTADVDATAGLATITLDHPTSSMRRARALRELDAAYAGRSRTAPARYCRAERAARSARVATSPIPPPTTCRAVDGLVAADASASPRSPPTFAAAYRRSAATSRLGLLIATDVVLRLRTTPRSDRPSPPSVRPSIPAATPSSWTDSARTAPRPRLHRPPRRRNEAVRQGYSRAPSPGRARGR